MLRIAVWLILLFMVVKIARLFLNWKQNAGSGEEATGRDNIVIPPFDNVQDADFEDITPKPPSEESGNPPA